MNGAGVIQNAHGVPSYVVGVCSKATTSTYIPETGTGSKVKVAAVAYPKK